MLIIFGILWAIDSTVHDAKPSCVKCKSKTLHYSHSWIRGWHKDGNGAVGDKGTRCFDCGYIKWDQSLEEYKSKLPEWVRAFEE